VTKIVTGPKAQARQSLCFLEQPQVLRGLRLQVGVAEPSGSREGEFGCAAQTTVWTREVLGRGAKWHTSAPDGALENGRTGERREEIPKDTKTERWDGHSCWAFSPLGLAGGKNGMQEIKDTEKSPIAPL